MTACPAPVAKPSPSAARMRRHRERMNRGAIFVRFEMTPAAVDRLIELRWLEPESRHDATAVTNAFLQFGAKALWAK